MAKLDRDAIFKKVVSIISDQLGVDDSKITMESSFVDDLNADSLDRVEMVMSFEEEFGFEIEGDDSEKILRVQDAVDYIEKHLK